MDNQEVFTIYGKVKESKLSGRYILPKKVNELLSNLPPLFKIEIAGFSVQKRPIEIVTFGSGKIKILMWSQMHGNESTTTKSLFDFFNFIQSKEYEKLSNQLLENCTFCIIPILNPDGSEVWTRENANKIDLNRDAQDLSQPESKILRKVFTEFNPDYCFNLHGQRTIYGFENSGKSSVLSFLSPAADVSRAYTFSRKRAASVISHIYKVLDAELPGQIGLYDDAFNGDCVGDTFQGLGVATILFEAGHYPDDYEREVTRKYVFGALIAAIEATIGDFNHNVSMYKAIPVHNKCFCDLHRPLDGKVERYQYGELLQDGIISFIPMPFKNAMGSGAYAHKTVKEVVSR